MGRKQPNTPKSRVRSAIRQLWLRSRERAAALKRDNYSCLNCGVKQSRVKGKRVDVQVHHIDGIDWEDVIKYIFDKILINPDGLVTWCVKCHDKYHKKEK